MTHRYGPPSYSLPRPTPEASIRLRSAEQAVAYLAAGVLRDGGVLLPAVEERLRVLCAELDVAYAAADRGAA